MLDLQRGGQTQCGGEARGAQAGPCSHATLAPPAPHRERPAPAPAPLLAAPWSLEPQLASNAFLTSAGVVPVHRSHPPTTRAPTPSVTPTANVELSPDPCCCGGSTFATKAVTSSASLAVATAAADCVSLLGVCSGSTSSTSAHGSAGGARGDSTKSEGSAVALDASILRRAREGGPAGSAGSEVSAEAHSALAAAWASAAALASAATVGGDGAARAGGSACKAAACDCAVVVSSLAATS
mmetsp:Transcript_19540/g.74947  ORF Transcript_19540/g.74947 Transcript_19540/m.74947 type:complete len:240 (-) Transcript_19540:1820-2539(-)